MPTGTSVNGFQLLGEDFPADQFYFYLHVPGAPFDSPSRVGFLYTLIRTAGAPLYTAVVDTRLIYSPGTFLVSSLTGSATTNTWAVVANWNFPDLPWELYVST